MISVGDGGAIGRLRGLEHLPPHSQISKYALVCFVGIFAAVTLACHVKYATDQWSTWSTHLRTLMLVGCLGQLAGVCAFAVYLALAISQHQS